MPSVTCTSRCVRARCSRCDSAASRSGIPRSSPLTFCSFTTRPGLCAAWLSHCDMLSGALLLKVFLTECGNFNLLREFKVHCSFPASFDLPDPAFDPDMEVKSNPSKKPTKRPAVIRPSEDSNSDPGWRDDSDDYSDFTPVQRRKAFRIKGHRRDHRPKRPRRVERPCAVSFSLSYALATAGPPSVPPTSKPNQSSTADDLKQLMSLIDTNELTILTKKFRAAVNSMENLFP
ncbi:hypothetical protein EVAR_5873_1 [Eumeta japonica]|uniref:Uncharacterized protein n=1 Tax=Eumeta variegata TaxID=151549 RepID=A0A4C1TD55_EUMVA|nr:hypothetical protein EVAR_5873_1 [Eumeta japonica]